MRAGDYVECMNCGYRGLVDFGEATCPHCKSEGTLAWASDNPDNQECTADFVGWKLMDELRDAKVSASGKIKASFAQFPAGTPVEEIKKYIRSEYPV